MERYKNILLALDLHDNCDRLVTERAVITAEQNQANLFLVHAVEHINAYGAAYAYPAVSELEISLVDEAKQGLATAGARIGVPNERQLVEFGPPKVVILRKAVELDIDLIIVGSHGRHGLELMLGSAANAVLHGAPCDVLAVRVR